MPTSYDEDAIAKMQFNERVMDNTLKFVLLPTELCNFRCRYCYGQFPKYVMSEDTQNGIIKYLKRNIMSHKALNISWFGGEPLLYPGIITNLSQKMIDLCRTRNKPYFSSITTNGYLLNQDVFHQMLNNKISLYMVTLDGFEELHNKNRKLQNGNGTFSTILSNLRNIRDNERSASFRIRIRVNVTTELIPELSDFIDFLYEEFGNDKRFNFIFVAASDYGGDEIKKMEKSILHSFDQVYDELINAPNRLDCTGFAGQLLPNICYAGMRNAYIIKANGTVSKCTVSYEDFSEVGVLHSDGNMLLDQSKLAKWVNREMSPQSSCAKCDRRGECDRACPLVYNFKKSIDCTCSCINVEKIVQLISMDNTRKYNQVIEID